MNNIIEYGYLQNHISATLLGSYTGPVVHDYGQEPIIFSSSTCATLIILSIVLVWEILSIGHSACLKKFTVFSETLHSVSDVYVL